jgi:hypothetical protein
MKKLIVIASLFLFTACVKEGITPEPVPSPEVVVVQEDTSKHNLVNTWTCYQYKYTYNNDLWIMQTAWNVVLGVDTIRIDEARDGEFEKEYPISILATPQGSVALITYPGPSTKTYEIRSTRVGKKQGYDLISTPGTDQDIYSFIK